MHSVNRLKDNLLEPQTPAPNLAKVFVLDVPNDLSPTQSELASILDQKPLR